MTSLLKKLSISIKIGVFKRYGVCLVSFQITDRIRRQSSWASCELCSHRRRQRDTTVSSRRRRGCVLGISGFPYAKQTATLHTPFWSKCTDRTVFLVFFASSRQILVMLLTLFAFVSDATLKRVELTLQSSIQALVVRTLSHEDEHKYDDDDHEYPSADTYNDRPPAGHRCACIRSRGVDVLQVTEIKGQVADSYLYNANVKCHCQMWIVNLYSAFSWKPLMC